MSTKGIGTTVDATTKPVSCKSINSNQKVTTFSPVQFKQQPRKGRRRRQILKMKDFNAKKQDLVSSRESMSTKGIGTTVDATMIPVSCKSLNSNQKVTSFSTVQFKQQPREEEGGDKF